MINLDSIQQLNLPSQTKNKWQIDVLSMSGFRRSWCKKSLVYPRPSTHNCHGCCQLSRLQVPVHFVVVTPRPGWVATSWGMSQLKPVECTALPWKFITGQLEAVMETVWLGNVPFGKAGMWISMLEINEGTIMKEFVEYRSLQCANFLAVVEACPVAHRRSCCTDNTHTEDWMDIRKDDERCIYV